MADLRVHAPVGLPRQLFFTGANYRKHVIDLTIADKGPGPADLATRGAEVERVVSALQQLPPTQRRCVVLASVHGRTAQEISEIEGIPVGTAKTRLRSGLLKLRRELVPEAAP